MEKLIREMRDFVTEHGGPVKTHYADGKLIFNTTVEDHSETIQRHARLFMKMDDYFRRNGLESHIKHLDTANFSTPGALVAFKAVSARGKEELLSIYNAALQAGFVKTEKQ
ncbi:MAG: hypothetical protein AABX01_08040 [Candidatus Micrarchaeota archaeon]